MKKYEIPSLEVSEFDFEEAISVTLSKTPDDGYTDSSESEEGKEDLQE